MKYPKRPLPNPASRDEERVYVEPYEVSARLRIFKKPNSQVPGDIPPALVSISHDLLAFPLSIVFNQVLNTLEYLFSQCVLSLVRS